MERRYNSELKTIIYNVGSFANSFWKGTCFLMNLQLLTENALASCILMNSWLQILPIKWASSVLIHFERGRLRTSNPPSSKMAACLSFLQSSHAVFDRKRFWKPLKPLTRRTLFVENNVNQAENDRSSAFAFLLRNLVTKYLLNVWTHVTCKS